MRLLTKIVGTKHYGASAIAAVGSLREGERITLRREPGNKVDPNAVSCLRGEYFLGYVPRRDNHELARLMDHGATATAEVRDRAIMLGGSIQEEPRINITVEEAARSPAPPPRYEAKPLPAPNPERLHGIWDRFTQSFVEGENHYPDMIRGKVAQHNSAFERSLQD